MRPPHPRVVEQLHAVLPDGSVDPAADTDCGEAVLSSVTLARRGLYLSPGCVRQGLGVPADNGSTTAEELESWLHYFGMRSEPYLSSQLPLWTALRRWNEHGQYLIALVASEVPGANHWVLAYGVHAKGLWCMDPAEAGYREISSGDFESLYRGVLIRQG